MRIVLTLQQLVWLKVVSHSSLIFNWYVWVRDNSIQVFTQQSILAEIIIRGQRFYLDWRLNPGLPDLSQFSKPWVTKNPRHKKLIKLLNIQVNVEIPFHRKISFSFFKEMILLTSNIYPISKVMIIVFNMCSLEWKILILYTRLPRLVLAKYLNESGDGRRMWNVKNDLNLCALWEQCLDVERKKKSNE